MRYRTYAEALRHLIGFQSGSDSDPSAVWAANEIADRSSRLRAAGYKVLTWTPARHHPLVVNHNGLWAFEHYGRLVDHPYRLRTPDGRTLFVVEPYGLSPEGLQQVAVLQQRGWRVEVRPEMAIHYPGRTVAVWIERGAA